MKFSLGWLRSHTDADLDLEKLANLGFPLESRQDSLLGERFVIAKVLKIEKHPRADRLSVCRVKSGSAEHQIVCGDPNLKEGQMTVLALPGATLPSGHQIKVSTLRGIESQGMLCSGQELGLDGAGVMSLHVEEKLLGKPVDLVLHPDGPVWDLEVTFNRPDMLSVRGIAREVGNTKNEEVPSGPEPKLEIQSEIGGLVLAYCEAEFDGLETPEWIQRRLKLQNSQSRFFPVDLTNYLLYDLGQPMHAFDAKKIKGRLLARPSKKGEKIKLLSGEEVILEAEIPIFADELGPVSIIGVMGGARTACDENTRHVLLEASYLGKEKFEKKIVESPSYRLSSRGLDPYAPLDAVQKARRILSLCEIRCSGTKTLGRPEKKRIVLDYSLIKKLVGELDINLLKRSGFKQIDSETWEIPSWRRIETQEAVAEELARVFGYDKIEKRSLKYRHKLLPSPDKITYLRTLLAGLGLHEVLTNSISQREGLPLPNTSKYLRSSLIPGLLDLYKGQVAKRCIQWPGVFEIGTCFTSEGDSVKEHTSLAILLNRECPPFLYQPKLDELLDLLSDESGTLSEKLPTFVHEATACKVHGGWAGLVYPEKEGLYGLELHLNTIPFSELKRSSPKPYGQTWRDLTLLYEQHPRRLYEALKSEGEVSLVSRYGTALTFRIWISMENPSKEKIDAVFQRYVDRACAHGARLQAY